MIKIEIMRILYDAFTSKDDVTYKEFLFSCPEQLIDRLEEERMRAFRAGFDTAKNLLKNENLDV